MSRDRAAGEAPPTVRGRRGIRRIFARFRYSPSRRFALLLAAVAPVWLLSGSPAGTLLATGLTLIAVAAAIVDALTLPDAGSLDVRRTLPGSIGLGEQADIEYRITSRWGLPLDIGIHDLMPGGVDRAGGDTPDRPAAAPPSLPSWIGRVRVPAHGYASIRTAVTGRTRGVHPHGRVVLRVRGRLALVRRSLEYAPGGATAVVPSLVGIRRYRLLTVQRRLRDVGIRTLRRRGEGATFASLREYVEGDDPRRVDWKATARRGKLITREYSVEQGQTVVIAIDAGRIMTQLSDGVSRFEHALTSAVLLADVATRSGDHVSLLVFNDQVRAFVPAARGSLAVRRIREAVLPLAANMMEPDYAGAFRTLAARHRKRSLVVLYTDVIDARASRALIAHTARSARRHLPLVVALRNDELAGAAMPAPDGDASVFESAAAE
ncbi:MAG: DUF58 domain-containing protein, partial [Gemmatimonadota bacterium]